MDSKEIRRRNLIYLADVKHDRKSLSEKLEYSDSSYLNQLVSRHSKMGDRTAKKIERRLGLADGWMDSPHPQLWGSKESETLDYVKDLLTTLSKDEIWKLIQMAQEELRVLDTKKGS